MRPNKQRLYEQWNAYNAPLKLSEQLDKRTLWKNTIVAIVMTETEEDASVLKWVEIVERNQGLDAWNDFDDVQEGLDAYNGFKEHYYGKK